MHDMPCWKQLRICIVPASAVCRGSLVICRHVAVLVVFCRMVLR